MTPRKCKRSPKKHTHQTGMQLSIALALLVIVLLIMVATLSDPDKYEPVALIFFSSVAGWISIMITFYFDKS